jgi:hypothetical protein
MVRRLGRLAALPAREKAILIEGLLVLAGSSLAIALLPFRKVATLASRFDPIEGSDVDLSTVSKCRWAVQAWADRVPWRAVCFQRGLALHLMLRRRGIPSLLHYGVAQTRDKGLSAHVWISAGDRLVLGGEQAPGYTCLSTFPGAPGD